MKDQKNYTSILLALAAISHQANRINAVKEEKRLTDPILSHKLTESINRDEGTLRGVAERLLVICEDLSSYINSQDMCDEPMEIYINAIYSSMKKMKRQNG